MATKQTGQDWMALGQNMLNMAGSLQQMKANKLQQERAALQLQDEKQNKAAEDLGMEMGRKHIYALPDSAADQTPEVNAVMKQQNAALSPAKQVKAELLAEEYINKDIDNQAGIMAERWNAPFQTMLRAYDNNSDAALTALMKEMKGLDNVNDKYTSKLRVAFRNKMIGQVAQSAETQAKISSAAMTRSQEVQNNLTVNGQRLVGSLMEHVKQGNEQQAAATYGEIWNQFGSAMYGPAFEMKYNGETIQIKERSSGKVVKEFDPLDPQAASNIGNLVSSQMGNPQLGQTLVKRYQDEITSRLQESLNDMPGTLQTDMELTRKDGVKVKMPAGTNLYMSKNYLTNSAGEVFPLYENEAAVGKTFWDVETLPESTRKNIDAQVTAIGKEMGWTPEQMEEYRQNAYAAEKGRLNKITNNGVPMQYLQQQVDRLQDAAYPVIGGPLDAESYMKKLQEIGSGYGDAVYNIPLSDGTEFRGTIPAWMDAEMEVRKLQSEAVKNESRGANGTPTPSPQPGAVEAPPVNMQQRIEAGPNYGIGDLAKMGQSALGTGIGIATDVMAGRKDITGKPIAGADQAEPRLIEKATDKMHEWAQAEKQWLSDTYGRMTGSAYDKWNKERYGGGETSAIPMAKSHPALSAGIDMIKSHKTKNVVSKQKPVENESMNNLFNDYLQYHHGKKNIPNNLKKKYTAKVKKYLENYPANGDEMYGALNEAAHGPLSEEYEKIAGNKNVLGDMWIHGLFESDGYSDFYGPKDKKGRMAVGPWQVRPNYAKDWVRSSKMYGKKAEEFTGKTKAELKKMSKKEWEEFLLDPNVNALFALGLYMQHMKAANK